MNKNLCFFVVGILATFFTTSAQAEVVSVKVADLMPNSSLLLTSKESKSSNLVAQNNDTQNTSSLSFTIAQITEASYPLYGSWKLTYSVNGTVYKGYLIMKGYYGDLRVSFFDPQTRKKATIDEAMKLMSSSQGLVLLGYDPVYAGTSVSHPTYAADNFVFSVQPDGSLVAATCDDQEQCSYVDMEFVK